MAVPFASRRFTCPEAYKDIVPTGCSFDEVVANLHLSPHQYRDSRELKEWVRHNKNQRYVPTELLKAFGFEVDV
jgi:hypothetical protein